MAQPPGSREADERSTVLRAKIDPTPLVDAKFALTVVEGPDTGRQLAFDALHARLLVGQSPACELRLTDPEVSRRHFALEVVGRRLRLSDLESTNGTFVDGVAVLEGFLRGGEVVRAGSTAIRVDAQLGRDAPELPTETGFGRVLGLSTEMRRLYPVFARIAASVVPVVIEGETGTGKEVLAEALHDQGPRAAKPFVVFDCTAVPPSLVESELFGHERGAFTGAVSTRKGVFEQAHGGTLLIDEIGDLELSLQPKLLRALERSEIRRVGGDRTIRVDVRILAATRRDLDHEVQAGRFRDDLFHRLAVARVELPPLRKRRGDVTLLAREFARHLGGGEAGLPSELLRRWEDYSWPGNVRELRNAVARQLALGELSALARGQAIPGQVGAGEVATGATTASGPFDDVLALGLPLIQARQIVVDAFERAYIERVLAAHGGVVSQAAAASGIARRHFQRLRARGR
jgi:transcriptional regulator with GAF, ATPase, and Fis domain